MSAVRERFLVSKDDRGVLAAGETIISCPSGNCAGGKGVTFPSAARAGMFVFYKNNVSYDPSATPTVGPFVFGMFNDSKGNGVVDEIIKIAGEKVSKDGFLSLRGSAPVAGAEEVSRFMFDCVKYDTLYSINIDFESDRTHKEHYKNRTGRLVIQYKPTNGACDTCSTDAIAREVACGLVDDFNNYRDPAIKKHGIPRAIRTEPIPVKAFVYNDTNYYFCLDGAEGDCGGCPKFSGIKGIAIQGVNYTFGGSLDSAGTHTHKSQVDDLLDNINCAFDKHQGFAYKTRGTVEGACMSLKIVVNSCKYVELIQDDDTLLAPCEVEAVTYTKPNPKPCIDCGGSDNADTTFDGAIGFVGVMAEDECDCQNPSDNEIRYYPTNITTSWGGFSDAVFDIIEEAQPPMNFGIQLWEKVYGGDLLNGYHAGQIRTGGKWNNLLAIARSKGVEVDCQIPYCVLSWQNYFGGNRPDPMSYHSGNVVGTVILIPFGDTTTKTALLADINALKNAGVMADVLADIDCTVDTDPVVSPSPSSTPDATPTATPSITPTRTTTKTPTATPSRTTTPSITPSRTPSPSA